MLNCVFICCIKNILCLENSFWFLLWGRGVLSYLKQEFCLLLLYFLYSLSILYMYIDVYAKTLSNPWRRHRQPSPPSPFPTTSSKKTSGRNMRRKPLLFHHNCTGEGAFHFLLGAQRSVRNTLPIRRVSMHVRPVTVKGVIWEVLPSYTWPIAPLRTFHFLKIRRKPRKDSKWMSNWRQEG